MVTCAPMWSLASTAREAGGDAVLTRALAAFGHTSLRPGQADVIADIFAGRPVIAVMPTGAGKSLCYQLPAVVLGERGGVTLVVSPLIALMKDQVDALRARGVPAVALTSRGRRRRAARDPRGHPRRRVHARLRRARAVPQPAVRRGAARRSASRIALVAIDEAHCISRVGPRLPPRLPPARPGRSRSSSRRGSPRSPRPPRPRSAHDIARAARHDRRTRCTSAASIGRTCTTRSTRPAAPPTRPTQLVELVRMREGGVALVYAATRKNAEAYAHDAASRPACARASTTPASRTTSARRRRTCSWPASST